MRDVSLLCILCFFFSRDSMYSVGVSILLLCVALCVVFRDLCNC